MRASRPIHSPRRHFTAGRAAARQPARWAGVSTQRQRQFSGSLAFGLLALAVCGLLVAIALVSGHLPTGAAAGATGPCGASDVSTCGAEAEWIPLRSTASG